MQILVFCGLFLLFLGFVMPAASRVPAYASQFFGLLALVMLGIGVFVFLVAVAYIIARLTWLGWLQVAAAFVLALVTLFMMATLQNLVLAREIRGMGGALFIILASALLIGLGGWLTARKKPPTSEGQKSLPRIPLDFDGRVLILEEAPSEEEVSQKSEEQAPSETEGLKAVENGLGKQQECGGT